MGSPGAGPAQAAAHGASGGKSPGEGSQIDGSSPKYSQRSSEQDLPGALAAHSDGSERGEPLPPHVARLTRQSVELIEQAREAGRRHPTTQLPPAPQLPP